MQIDIRRCRTGGRLTSIAFGVLVLAVRAADMTLYVAPGGNDAWSGRLAEANAARTDGPLATIAAARDAVRRRRPPRARARATVVLRGGSHSLRETLVLTAQDSGVTYTAYPGETPVVSGGRAIEDWRPEAGGLWSAPIGPEAADWVFRQLFVNGRRCVRARSPNQGWYTIAGRAPARIDRETGKEVVQDRTAFRYRAGDVRRWADANEVNVVVYHSWETSRLRIEEVDEATQVVRFTGGACWPFERWGTGQRYYVENVRDALDAPGEWYLDRARGVVLYRPRAGEDMRTAEVVAPFLTRLVHIQGDPALGMWVEDVVFRGIVFRHEDWELEPQGHSDAQAVVTAPAAIMADGALNCAFEDCEISRVGHYGIWLRHACRGNRVVRNRIHDLGIGGVRIGEAAMPKTDALTSCGNLVDNNHIFDGGHVYPAGVGVWVAQSHHNVISHNEIHDFNYSGMSIGWNWNDADNRCHHNTIEYNHVHHVMNGQLNDGGAIYTLGSSPGSIIRNNLFHDVWPYSAIGWGIYLDATTNQVLVENNIVYNTLSGGLMKHNGGHLNVIRNNVFAFSAHQMLWPCWDVEPNTFERNIVYFTQGLLFIPMAETRLKQRLRAGDSLGVWDRNCYWNPRGESLRFFAHTFEDWQKRGLDRESVVADPLFVDADAHDFRLQSGSPAFHLGFQPIDTSSIGLYGDPAWVAEARAVTHPPTALPEAPPPPEYGPIADDFENTDLGAQPRRAVVDGEELGASVRVSDEAAAAGSRSLKIVDADGLEPSWQPHMFYRPHLTEGLAHQSFDILLEARSLLYTEWRDDTGYPECIGPSVTFDGGEVTASGQPIGTVPVGVWIRVEIACGVGASATGTYSVTLTPADGSKETGAEPSYAGTAFREVHWLGFVSTATHAAVCYVDNVRIRSVTD